MDLNTIKTGDRTVNLQHPKTGKDLGLVFHLRAPDSEEVKKVDRDWQNRKLQPKYRNKVITSEELEVVAENRILASVFDWEWTDANLKLNGEQPEFSTANLRKMLEDHQWVRDFLDAECEDITSFF